MIAPAYWPLVLKITRSAPGEPRKQRQPQHHQTSLQERLTSSVNPTLLDRELLVRAAHREVKALVVVVLVRVVAGAGLVVVGVVAVALVQGGADLAGAVVVVAAGGGGLADFELGLGDGGWGGEGAGCEEQGGGEDGEAHLDGFGMGLRGWADGDYSEWIAAKGGRYVKEVCILIPLLGVWDTHNVYQRRLHETQLSQTHGTLQQ